MIFALYIDFRELNCIISEYNGIFIRLMVLAVSSSSQQALFQNLRSYLGLRTFLVLLKEIFKKADKNL
jgi:hypothetical protein